MKWGNWVLFIVFWSLERKRRGGNAVPFLGSPKVSLIIKAAYVVDLIISFAPYSIIFCIINLVSRIILGA